MKTLKQLNISMPVLEIPSFNEEDIETQNLAKSEEVERKNYRLESPRKKMKLFARLKCKENLNDINKPSKKDKMEKQQKKPKITKEKEISKSDPIENIQLKIGLEIQQNDVKINNQYHFKEMDLGGYTLVVAPKIEKEESEEYFTKKNLAKLLKAEHKNICQKEPFLTPNLSFYQKQEKYPTSCSYINYSKNRYQDVLCNEDTKFLFFTESNDYLHQSMELEQSLEALLFDMHATRTRVEENKYINANYVKGFHCSNTTFIATQAPLEKTFPEFFEMLWQSKSKVIISLTPFVEKQKAKMTPFWPMSTKKPLVVSHFTISLSEEKSQPQDFIIRKLEIKNLNNGITRSIYQIHFNGWLDNDIPSDPFSLIQIYSFQKKFQAEGSLEGLDGPVVVHCSAGIGRTSTYISFVFGAQIASYLKNTNPLFTRLDLNVALDVPSIVINVRKQRCGSVQTWKQYGLIYKAINYYIKHQL